MSKSDISHCPIQQRDSIGYESNTRAPNVTGFEDIPFALTRRAACLAAVPCQYR
jgi:hypothetical protein